MDIVTKIDKLLKTNWKQEMKSFLFGLKTDTQQNINNFEKEIIKDKVIEEVHDINRKHHRKYKEAEEYYKNQVPDEEAEKLIMEELDDIDNE